MLIPLQTSFKIRRKHCLELIVSKKTFIPLSPFASFYFRISKVPFGTSAKCNASAAVCKDLFLSLSRVFLCRVSASRGPFKTLHVSAAVCDSTLLEVSRVSRDTFFVDPLPQGTLQNLACLCGRLRFYVFWWLLRLAMTISVYEPTALPLRPFAQFHKPS